MSSISNEQEVLASFQKFVQENYMERSSFFEKDEKFIHRVLSFLQEEIKRLEIRPENQNRLIEKCKQHLKEAYGQSEKMVNHCAQSIFSHKLFKASNHFSPDFWSTESVPSDESSTLANSPLKETAKESEVYQNFLDLFPEDPELLSEIKNDEKLLQMAFQILKEELEEAKEMPFSLKQEIILLAKEHLFHLGISSEVVDKYVGLLLDMEDQGPSGEASPAIFSMPTTPVHTARKKIEEHPIVQDFKELFEAGGSVEDPYLLKLAFISLKEELEASQAMPDLIKLTIIHCCERYLLQKGVLQEKVDTLKKPLLQALKIEDNQEVDLPDEFLATVELVGPVDSSFSSESYKAGSFPGEKSEEPSAHIKVEEERALSEIVRTNKKEVSRLTSLGKEIKVLQEVLDTIGKIYRLQEIIKNPREHALEIIQLNREVNMDELKLLETNLTNQIQKVQQRFAIAYREIDRIYSHILPDFSEKELNTIVGLFILKPYFKLLKIPVTEVSAYVDGLTGDDVTMKQELVEEKMVLPKENRVFVEFLLSQPALRGLEDTIDFKTFLDKKVDSQFPLKTLFFADHAMKDLHDLGVLAQEKKKVNSEVLFALSEDNNSPLSSFMEKMTFLAQVL